MKLAQPTRDQVQGCLLGGAAGDALGAPVESMSRSAILARYGSGGIRDFASAYGRVGAITDDTQMTLFTVEGLIRADFRFIARGICNPIWVMRYAYERWLATQGYEPTSEFALEAGAEGWLIGVRELHSARAPGRTCVAALLEAPTGEWAAARNDSKGCGGVMRVAPIGLVATDPYDYGAKAAAITHGHPLGWQSAGFLCILISKLLVETTIGQAVEATLKEVPAEADEVARWLRRATDLAASDLSSEECIESLGEGWVAEEALAISVFCALRGRSLEDAVVTAVNHSGDSDSTGSITGQICGTFYGVGKIPQRWLDQLELREVIGRLADDLSDWMRGEALEQDPTGPSGIRDDWWHRYPGG